MNASTAETLSTLAAAIDGLAAAATNEDVQRLVTAAARRLTGADGASLALREVVAQITAIACDPKAGFAVR